MAADRPMQLGMIGLGRMGSNLVRRLMRDGHHCVAARPHLQDDHPRSRQRRAHPEPDPDRRHRSGRLPALRPERRGALREDGPQRRRVRDDGRDRRGLSVIKHANAGRETQVADAETTPLREPEADQYDIDVAEVAEVWRRGSVVGSWLVDLIADAFARSPDLDGFAGRVSDSGEGRWTVLASGAAALHQPGDLMPVDMAGVHVGQRAGMPRRTRRDTRQWCSSRSSSLTVLWPVIIGSMVRGLAGACAGRRSPAFPAR